MKLEFYASDTPRRKEHSAFSLAEVLISVLCFSIVTVSLYTGLAQGFRVVGATQANLRATQILQEQAEIIRLYTWDQINSNGFIPATFTAPFYLAATQNTSGLSYTGHIKIADAPLTESYSNDLKLVTISLNWTQGTVQHQREASTLVSRYGLHNYYYHIYP
jgi:Tfp pilus assembly protein PilV